MPRVPRVPGVSGALAVVLAALSGCGHTGRPAMCTRTCDDGFACVSGECLRAGALSDVEALDKFGLYKARRIVVPAVEALRLAPGDTAGEMPPVVTLGRKRDEAAVLLLRFALDLSPDATVLEAHVLLDRAPSLDADPTPIALHASRIVEPWDARLVSWGRAPRIEETRSPQTVVDLGRPQARIDVRSLILRWRRHGPDDQGIAIVADADANQGSVTGMAFVLADGAGATDEKGPVVPVRSLRDTPPTFHAAADVSEAPAEGLVPRAPRLEIYVKP
jgi:hypothetical protein